MWLRPNEPVADIALSPWQIQSTAWRWRPWIISEVGSAAIVLSLLYCDTVHVSPNHAAVAFEPSHIHIEHKYKSCSLPHPEPLYDMKNHGVATCSRVFATDGMGQQEFGDRENFQVTSSWKLQTCRRVIMGKRVGKNWMPAFSRMPLAACLAHWKCWQQYWSWSLRAHGVILSKVQPTFGPPTRKKTTRAA